MCWRQPIAAIWSSSKHSRRRSKSVLRSPKTIFNSWIPWASLAAKLNRPSQRIFQRSFQRHWTVWELSSSWASITTPWKEWRVCWPRSATKSSSNAAPRSTKMTCSQATLRSAWMTFRRVSNAASSGRSSVSITRLWSRSTHRGLPIGHSTTMTPSLLRMRRSFRGAETWWRYARVNFNLPEKGPSKWCQSSVASWVTLTLKTFLSLRKSSPKTCKTSRTSSTISWTWRSRDGTTITASSSKSSART